MEKIIFEDLPSTNTPINAENLNKIQENVENTIEELKNVYGKYIHLVKNNIQSLSAETAELVVWETTSYNDTNDLLQIINNKVTLTSGIHTVLIIARIQIVEEAEKYLYIRKWVNNQKQELASMSTTEISLALTTVTQLKAGDSISIESYSNIVSDIKPATSWTELKVILLN